MKNANLDSKLNSKFTSKLASKFIDEFQTPIQFLLTDIDDTLTNNGRLGPQAYQAMWDLDRAGIGVIPVTGRPAGWCELIARFWPVNGVVGENGAFYFRYHQQKMIRHFARSEKQRTQDLEKLEKIKQEILQKVPESRVSPDQFCRLFDLAIDFAEDFLIPLNDDQIQKIVDIFIKNGTQAKVSSIHVNGWFGEHSKLTESLLLLEKEFGISSEEAKRYCAFVGDSPNDEPMWEFFPHSFGVSNIENFRERILNPPSFICRGEGGIGFYELAQHLIKIQQSKK